jgi:hypothetical protein
MPAYRPPEMSRTMQQPPSKTKPSQYQQERRRGKCKVFIIEKKVQV